MSIVEEKNKIFLEKLNAKREDLLRHGANYPGHIDKSGNGTAFIRPEDEPEYDAINELKGYLEFKTYDPQKTFILPGVTINGVTNEQGKPLQMTICIQENDIKKILGNIEKYKKLGITFPDQLYQFKYEQPIPGKSYKAPRPMLVEETEEQYEAFLKEYYERNGEQQELIGDDIKTRKPYTHEMIPYAEEYKVDRGHVSEYYMQYMQNAIKKHTRQPSPGAGNHRVQDGEEYVFKESVKGEKILFLQRVGSFGHGVKTNLANGSTGTKVKTVAGIALVIGIGGAALTSTYVWPIALVGLGSYATYRLMRPLLKKLKEKNEDLLYGKKLDTEEPPQGPSDTGDDSGSGDGGSGSSGDDSGNGGGSGSGGNGGQGQPQGDDNFNMRIEELLNELGMNANLYKDIETKITIAEEELTNLAPNSPAYAQKQEQLAGLKKQKKKLLEIVSQQIENYGKSVQPQTGGPHRV